MIITYIIACIETNCSKCLLHFLLVWFLYSLESKWPAQFLHMTPLTWILSRTLPKAGSSVLKAKVFKKHTCIQWIHYDQFYRISFSSIQLPVELIVSVFPRTPILVQGGLEQVKYDLNLIFRVVRWTCCKELVLLFQLDQGLSLNCGTHKKNSNSLYSDTIESVGVRLENSNQLSLKASSPTIFSSASCLDVVNVFAVASLLSGGCLYLLFSPQLACLIEE